MPPMSESKKPNRKETQAVLEDAARRSVGDETDLDAAFAVFDDALAADPQRLAEAQKRLRALLKNDI